MWSQVSSLIAGGVPLASSRGSSNGPDWTDLDAAIRAVEEFHEAYIYIIIGTNTLGSRGGLLATAEAFRTTRKAVGARPSVSRSLMIGYGDPEKAVAALFRLIHELDRDCGQMWAQAELFESV